MTISNYRKQLEADGVDSEMVYNVTSCIERMHELFAIANGDQRLVLQHKFGTRFVKELENFGGYTNKQTTLAVRTVICDQITSLEVQSHAD